jgi:hypothetical protein
VLRTLVAGARLAVLGPIAAILALLGLLFFVVPGVMALVFGIISVWLAVLSGVAILRRHGDPGSRAR